MAGLPTNYQDAILAETMNGKRRVRLVPVGDGLYEVEDVTEYDQEGSSYGALEINRLNNTVNGKLEGDTVIDDRQTALLVNTPGVPVGCQAFAALNNDLGNCTFFVQEDGPYIKYVPLGGADPVLKKLGSFQRIELYSKSIMSGTTVTVNVKEYSGWENFSAENFVYQVTTISRFTAGSAEDYVANIKLSYNSDTGDVTLAVDKWEAGGHRWGVTGILFLYTT